MTSSAVHERRVEWRVAAAYRAVTSMSDSFRRRAKALPHKTHIAAGADAQNFLPRRKKPSYGVAWGRAEQSEICVVQGGERG